MINHHLDTYGKALNLSISDNILSTNEDSIRQKIFDILDSTVVKNADWNTLNLDLTAVRMVDSIGLNLIITLVQNIKNRGGKIVTKVVEGTVLRSFTFARIDKQMEIIVVKQ